MIKAVLFDLDGTLIDSEVIYVAAVQTLLIEKNHEIPHEDSLRIVYGKSTQDIYVDLERLFPGLFASVEVLENEIRQYFLRLRNQRDVRIHSSIDLLKKLAESYPVAIVSGSPRRDIEEGIQSMEIEPYIEFYLGSEDYYPGKPDPACYLTAAARFSLPPQKCLVFEDSYAGVRAAKSAGMYCIGLRRPGAPYQDLRSADRILQDLSEFDTNWLAASTR